MGFWLRVVVFHTVQSHNNIHRHLAQTSARERNHQNTTATLMLLTAATAKPVRNRQIASKICQQSVSGNQHVLYYAVLRVHCWVNQQCFVVAGLHDLFRVNDYSSS